MTLTFNEELRSSKLPLEELLIKYNLNLRTALQRTKIPPAKKRKETGGAKHITRWNDKYQLVKSKNGKSYYLGLYNTLEDAVKVRDKLEEYDWDKNKLKHVLKETGVCKCGKRQFTFWNSHKVGYSPHGVTKKFYLVYNGQYVSIGYFHDFLSCEIIHDLILAMQECRVWRISI